MLTLRGNPSIIRVITLEDFFGRVLSFDDAAAQAFALIAAEKRLSGRPMGAFDVQIAAIARSRGAIIVTRNVADFQDCELVIINPWTS